MKNQQVHHLENRIDCMSWKYNYSIVMNWAYQPPNVCNDHTLFFTQNFEIVHNKNDFLEVNMNDRIFS